MDTSQVDASNVVVAVGAVTDTLNNKVIALIIDLTGNNSVFTAFDITKQVRSENIKMDVPHQDVKDMVIAEFNNDFCDEYKRSFIELTVGYSFVYHPEAISAKTHPLAVQPITDPTPTSSDTNTDLTVEKRLNIPKTFLGKLSLVAGKRVRVETGNGVITLSETTYSPPESLFVNTDGRLRINAQTLTDAFGRIPDKYDISVSDDGMYINVKPK